MMFPANIWIKISARDRAAYRRASRMKHGFARIWSDSVLLFLLQTIISTAFSSQMAVPTAIQLRLRPAKSQLVTLVNVNYHFGLWHETLHRRKWSGAPVAFAPCLLQRRAPTHAG